MRIPAAFFAGLLATSGAWAQTFPAKPIRMVIGYAPGGSGDFISRLMANEMGKTLGKSVVVENVAGAGGNIAASQVARSPADGHTVLVTGHLAVNKALYKNPGFDADKDFAPISRLATGSTIILVKNSLPIHTLKELVDDGKAHPGKLFNASAGVGSAPHLASALFESVTGARFTSVQYKGGGPAAIALMAGETDVMFAVPPTVMGFIKDGRMRPLALTQPHASPSVPGIPGAADAGVPGYSYTFWFGLFAPAGTPTEAINKLNEAAAAALARPEVREKIASQGMEATPSPSPQVFGAEVRKEGPELEKMIRDAAITAE